MVEDDPLISCAETAVAVKQKTQTLAAWRCNGKGPKYLKIGRAVYYRESAIRDFLEAQERDPADKLDAA